MDLMQLLPPDIIISHIFNHLDFTSRIRAGAVSRSWRVLSQAAPQISGMPWIWFSPRNNKRKRRDGLLNLSFSCRATSYKNRCPVFYDQNPIGARGGGQNITLTSFNPSIQTIYNPFTNDVYQLPCTNPENPYSSGMVHLLQLSSKPPNCLIAGWGSLGVYICKLGDPGWVKEQALKFERKSRIHDLIFFKGQLYSIDEERILAYDAQAIYNNQSFNGLPPRDVVVYDTEDAWCNIYTSHQIFKHHYLVESGGELLVVTQYKPMREYNVFFAVHKLNHEQGRLERIYDLGDERMLFIGDGCSYSWSAINDKRSIYFEKNCIYLFVWSPPIFVGKFYLDAEKFKTKMMSELCNGVDTMTLDRPLWVTPTFPN